MEAGKNHIVIAALVMAGVAASVQSAGAGPNCTCRANGANYPLGKIMCIRGKLARCEMNQNVTNWKIIASICPTTRKDQTLQFASAPMTTIPHK